MEDINEIDIYMRQKLEALLCVMAVGALERRGVEGKRKAQYRINAGGVILYTF